jgi:hypothetical protein
MDSLIIRIYYWTTKTKNILFFLVEEKNYFTDKKT